MHFCVNFYSLLNYSLILLLFTFPDTSNDLKSENDAKNNKTDADTD